MAKVRPFSYLIGSESSGLKTAQILSPAFCQFVTTPIHLLGLDLHNRQHKLGVLERVQIIRRDVFVAIPLRMLRIVPAFGIGNVVNISVRRSLMEKVVEQR
jgi:hypothetical protein